MLYLIKSGEWYKIGYAKNVAKRLDAYNTHNPNYELLGVKEGTLEDETSYHKSQSQYPQRYE